MDLTRKLAVLFGIAFVGVGILGFVPMFVTTDGLLLGIFKIDSMHNMVHLASGVVALLASTNFNFARLYFQVFGVVYGLVGVWGLITGNVMGMEMNMADHLLHLGIAAISLYVGFVLSKRS